jgi:hypothetical protein
VRRLLLRVKQEGDKGLTHRGRGPEHWCGVTD